ncbi:MAG: hypothetical protein AAF447_16735, partial [Myxococcota bacterium]
VARAVLRGASAVAAGGATSCALVAGRVLCWGRGERGQRGVGRAEGSPEPAPVVSAEGPLERVVELALGVSFGCARDAAGTVWCWGDGSEGQLGAFPELGYRPWAAPVLRGAEALALGPRSACAREGVAWRCWGANGARQLLPSPARPLQEPRAAPDFAGAAVLGLGARHSCASREGVLRCRGASRSGALGLGSRRRSRVLAPVPLPGPVGLVALGPDFTCARLPEGPFCWGAGYASSPQPVPRAAMEGGGLEAPDAPL